MTITPQGSECQCPGCAHIFTTPSALDLHQVWLGKGDDSQLLCLDPSDLGYVQRERRGGRVWSFGSEGAPPVRARRKALIARLVRKFGVLGDGGVSDSPKVPGAQEGAL